MAHDGRSELGWWIFNMLVLPFFPYFHCLDPEPYLKYGSGTTFLNTYPIWIRIHSDVFKTTLRAAWQTGTVLLPWYSVVAWCIRQWWGSQPPPVGESWGGWPAPASPSPYAPAGQLCPETCWTASPGTAWSCCTFPPAATRMQKWGCKTEERMN